MLNTYALSAPQQRTGYVELSLYDRRESTAWTYCDDPVAKIHVRNSDGEARIMTPACPVGVRANGLEHAVSFLKSLLQITHLEAAQ